jgi:hypothetical protein
MSQSPKITYKGGEGGQEDSKAEFDTPQEEQLRTHGTP